MKRNYIFILYLIFIFVSNPAFAEEINWQYWKGPNSNGISYEKDWDKLVMNRPLKLRWKLNVGYGYSSVAIYGNKLYTMGFNEFTGQNTLYCIDIISGKRLWYDTYKSSKGKHTGPKSSPVIDNGKVYTMSQDGILFCSNADNGRVIWKKDLVKDFGAKKLMWELSSSVCIRDNIAIINVCRSGIALNKNTGEVIWKSEPDTANYASPVIFEYNNKAYAAIFGKDALNAVDIKTGEILWSFPWKTTYNIIAADPVIYDNKIFISSGYGNGCALIDISSGTPVELWRNKELSTHFSTAVILDGYIYGIDGNAGTDASLKCLDLKDGSVKWSRETGFGNMIAVDGHLVLINESGSVFIIKADHFYYNEISAKHNVLPKLCWTAPVLCRGTLYLRNDKGDLLSIDVNRL